MRKKYMLNTGDRISALSFGVFLGLPGIPLIPIVLFLDGEINIFILVICIILHILYILAVPLHQIRFALSEKDAPDPYGVLAYRKKNEI